MAAAAAADFALAVFLSLVFSSAAPFFLKPAPSTPPGAGRLSASIHLSRLSAASKAKWKSKHGIPRPVPIPNSILFKLIQLFKNARGKTVHCFILIRRFGTSLIFSTITNPSEVSSPPPPSAAFAFLVTVRLRKHSVTFRPVPVLPSMLFFLPSLVKCEMDFSCENNFFPPQFATAYK